MTTDIDKLQEWDDRIQEYVKAFGLNCYPQEFEVCDHNDMIGYMAYSGMPSRYQHWSYGKNFERQKTMYEYGVSGLPYEMVINSNPCLAYLMRDNTLLLQILTIAHVYGHNDFFANNFTFTSGTEAKYVLERFRTHSLRISTYLEDPSIGLEAVEEAIDHAHALSFQCNRNLAVKKRSHEEQISRILRKAHGSHDPHWEIHPKRQVEIPDLNKFPLESDPDILEFIATYNPFLPEWKRDIMRIVAYEASYFMPQMDTKIMNEGWASYWHHKILNAMELPQDLHLEFLVRHNQVLRPHPGGINPYHLGFVIWNDIEKRWNEGRTDPDEPTEDNPRPEVEIDPYDTDTPGRKKIFEVRLADRDSSFLRRFLTKDIVRELELFQHEKRGKDRVITKVADDDGWREVKETLINSVGTASIPVIKIEDADFGRNRTLYLKHYHDGRDLQLQYAEATLRHIRALWERDVVLETELNSKRSLLKFAGDSFKIEKL